MMTMSSGRVLKFDEIGEIEIVALHSASSTRVAGPTEASLVADLDQALLFTATEVEDLCEKARMSGAADAASVLEPALNRIADAFEAYATVDADAAAAAQRCDAEAIVATAIDVARWILGRELSDPDEMVKLIERALDRSLTTANSTLFVHPELAAVMSEIVPGNVEVIADRTVEVGEFRSEAAGPDISFRFDVALGRAAEALFPGETS